MAGNYPDVPSWRMAWDRDGSVGLTIANNVPSQVSSATLISMNDETAAGSVTSPFVVIFPEKRDLDGYLALTQPDGSASLTSQGEWLWTSTDTTNGIDGTWVSLYSNPTVWHGNAEIPIPAYRTSIRSSTVLGIKAIKVAFTAGRVGTLHLYGEISPDENPNRLALWHPTLDQRITPTYFDWGNVPRSSSADRTFRVKNLSTVQTANSIRVAQEILTDTTPSVVGQHTLMKASVPSSFLAQVNVGDLAAGAISEVVTLRRVTPSNAVLSLWCHRVFAEATTWS